MKRKRLGTLALLLAATMGLTACGGGGSTPSTTAANSGGASAETTAAAAADNGSGSTGTTDTSEGGKVLKLDISDTPETLNPHTTATNYELLLDMTATLYRKVYDPETASMQFIPSVADGEPVPADDTLMKWTIKVQDGYTFADGTPIDANTFDYSMKMLNDPKLANRNVDASDLLNGEAYLAGECEWSEVGFKAVDANTIEVEFMEGREPASVRDMMELFAFVGTGAVHEATYEACMSADRTSCTYGSNLDSFVASGLYQPTELIQGQFLALERRTDGKELLGDVYTPDRVEYYAVTDANTKVQMFEKGELSAVIANQPAYDGYSGARYVYTADNMGLYLNSVSPEAEVLKDVNFRYALFWGLDRENVVKAVFPTSMPSAYMYLPISTIADPADPVNSVLQYHDTPEAKAIRMDGHEVDQISYDPDLAKEYFDKAYEANGNQKITITVKYSDSNDTNRNWAEALQSHYQTLFGEDRLELTLQAVPAAIMYEEISREKMNYDICVSCGWYNAVDKPWNNTNWLYSGPYTYNTQYCTIADESARQEWDEIFYSLATGDKKHDDQAKLEGTARLEEILYNDCSFVPAYSRGYRWFFSQEITPLMETGDWDLQFCLMQATFN